MNGGVIARENKDKGNCKGELGEREVRKKISGSDGKEQKAEKETRRRKVTKPERVKRRQNRRNEAVGVETGGRGREG